MGAEKSETLAASSILTTLCPLKNRPEHFRRFLICMDLVDWRGPMLFLDGSGSDECEAVWSTERTHVRRDQAVEYIRFSQDKGWPQFLAKMLAGLERVNTEYVHLTCDDDFPDQNSLLYACEVMNQRSDIALVSGKVVDFEVHGPKSARNRDVFGRFVLESRHLDCSGRYSQAKSVQEETPRRRLDRQSHIWPYEGVWRTEHLKEAFLIAQRAGASTYRTLLPIMRTVVLAHGNVLHMDRVFTLRQDNTRNSDGATMLAAHETRLDFFLSSEAELERRNVSRELLRLSFVEDGNGEDAIAVAAWQLYDLLEELKKSRDESNMREQTVYAILQSRIRSRLEQRFGRLLDRMGSPSRRSSESQSGHGTLDLQSWYPGDTQLVAAVSASVHSFGRRDDARSTFGHTENFL